jgi:hypothetical protein
MNTPTEIQPADVKQCASCEEYKLLTEFHKNSSRPDKKQRKCKACIKEYNEKRRARLLAEDPNWETKFRAANKEYQVIWRRNNRARSLKYSRDYYARNRERVALKNRNARLARALAKQESREA